MTVPTIANGAYPIPDQPWRFVNDEYAAWEISSGCLMYEHGTLGAQTAHAEQTLPDLDSCAGQNVTVTFDILDSSGSASFVPVFSLGGGTEVAASTGNTGTGYTVVVPVGYTDNILRITNHWTGSSGRYFVMTNISLS